MVSYDYTVLAGTQGMRNHAKTDRVFELAARKRLPVVLFAEGGGGRPGDTDVGGAAGLDVPTFRVLAGLRGRVPLVSIVSGRCFAGNAALAGVCDVIIATPDANIGMGGPAMIEGGGLGVYPPEAIGPIDVQRHNGVVSLVARDEAHAVSLAKQYLSYFQGSIGDWEAPDPRLARHVVPENRLRAYDVRRAIESIVDVGSVLELRPDYGVGIVTALVRVQGAAYGLLANSSHHLGGAIDAEAADKAGDFLTLCESFRLPVISLCDTPGFMVGPDAEKQAAVRRFGRMFVLGARLTVPLGMIILRKGYGLGAMAMAGGSFHAPQFTVAWPTGEIGGMGLEGAVRLGFSKELAAATDGVERQQLFDRLVAAAYEHGKALRAATTFELDDVIDPSELPGLDYQFAGSLRGRIDRGYQAWPEPQPTPGRQPVPPGMPPGPAFWPPEPQPTPGMQPVPPGPPPGPLIWPPEPQLPLASQPPPPGSSLKTDVRGVGPVMPVQPARTSAAATGAAAIAAATAPATTSGFMRVNFANMRLAYHARACTKHREQNLMQLSAAGGTRPAITEEGVPI